MPKELVFFQDVANWVVYHNTNIIDAIRHSAELTQYSNAELTHDLKHDMRYVILSPDKSTQILAKYAINRDSKLTANFKQRVEYTVSDKLKYILMLNEFETRLRYWGYISYINEFNKDKPWNDYLDRGFEIFSVQPEQLIAKVLTYNSYLKQNEILKLWYRPNSNSYCFKEDRKDPRLQMSFETIDHKYALDNCLNELKYRTCLIPISITKYFADKN